ncbi:coiled-coil alpha-helical rod protein 1-like [Saccoglossus kowalevskii]
MYLETGMVDEKCKAVSAEYVEKLAEVEKRLNEVRREHTKAVVSLRQMERQLVREKERHAEKLKTEEEIFQKQLDKVQNQLREVETERNIVMTTLRQEGLLGKYKSSRPDALSADEVSTSTQEENELDTVPTKQRTSKVTVESVVGDLQALTAAILDDNASSQ